MKDCLKQLAKALAVPLAFVLIMLTFGVNPASAKFGVISTLAFFAGEFYFLYEYMDVIGLVDSLGTPGLDLSNPPPPLPGSSLGHVLRHCLDLPVRMERFAQLTTSSRTLSAPLLQALH